MGKRVDNAVFEDSHILDAVCIAPSEADLPADVRAAYAYWSGMCSADSLPHVTDFSLMGLPPSLIPASMMYDVIDGGADYRYRFFGTERVGSHGEDYTGRHVSDIIPEIMAKKISDENAIVVRTKEPLVVETTAANRNEPFTYAMLRLPLVDDNGDVVRIYALPYGQEGGDLPEREWGHWFGRHAKAKA